MRKFIFASLVLPCLVGPCLAEFGIFQTALPSRVQKNLVTDYGGTCNTQVATKVVSITSSTAALSVTTNTFVSGDVGKSIVVPGAGSGGGDLSTTIASFTDAQNITLAGNASTTLTASSRSIYWGADDSAAFLSFKAAFQNTTPVQLNIPGNCTFKPVGGGSTPAFFAFKGIGDLVFQGVGPGLSGIFSLNGGLTLGGLGQYEDNNHSERTIDANVSDSCVTLKTFPSVTVSNITNNLPVPATFNATISGTLMTVNSVASGTIVAGAYLTNVNSIVTSFTSVMPYGTGGTTGVGGTGTYQLSISNASISARTTTTVPASFNATISTSGILTIAPGDLIDGAIAESMYIYPSNGGAGSSNQILPFGTAGTTGTGGAGTYKVYYAPTSTVSLVGFIGNGQNRVTLNSTTGISTGDVLFFNNIVSTGALINRQNGLQWLKVINGTQVDMFQQDFNGQYVSGGIAGGDRTSVFPVGSTVLMTGWSNQSYWRAHYGQPSNPHYFEYKKVVSTNSSTHQVCFDSPLIYDYKASWPQYDLGDGFHPDQGGPATLYVYDPSWETSVVIKDMTITSPGQTYIRGRLSTLSNVDMTGAGCVSPTQNGTVNWINVTGASCLIETDKIVTNWNLSNVAVRKVDIQSSSFSNITADNVSTTIGWYGSGKKLAMTNSNNADQKFGITAYGASDESTCLNCTTGGVAAGTPITAVDQANYPWSMSSGVITIPNYYSTIGNEMPVRGMVPNHYIQWVGSGNGASVQAQRGRFFKIVSVSQDIDNTYVTTSEAAGFPTGAWTTNGLSVAPHPAPKMTVSFLPGSSLNSLVLNGCSAQAPMYSCANYITTNTASGSTPAYSAIMWGVLDTFTFTNNVPYTNTGALGWTTAGFGNIQVLKTDNTTTTWSVASASGGQINTKLPATVGGGTRTLTQSGATGTQALDNLTAPPTDAYFGTSLVVFGSTFTANTPSDSPQVTVTLRTNQNLPP